jgi:hypothetical protein
MDKYTDYILNDRCKSGEMTDILDLMLVLDWKKLNEFQEVLDEE